MLYRQARLIFYVFFQWAGVICFGQEFGGHPPSMKWNQLNTDTARIIFPVGLDSQANRVASIIHYLAARKPLSLGDRLKKINVVLQDQTTLANGYVNLGPFRSEFFLMTELNNFQEGSIAWADQLAVHEYRHVMQFNNFHNGISKLMSFLFGEEGYSVAINASIPDWFYEGDAVYNETVLTKQGRGRLPLFLNGYPAIWQAGKNYSWMKLRNGSYKDYVPNHYFLGYLLVNYGREKYGADFWTKVTQDASAFKGLFYPFQKAIQKYAGVDYQTFRKQAFDHYKNSPGYVNKNTTNDNAREITPVNKKYVTSYYYPQSMDENSMVYLKTDLRHRPAFFIKTSSDEKRLKVKSISIDEQFSYRNGKIVYAAYETDPRWSWRDYSVIKMLDVNTKKETTLTKRSKYFTPDISPDGSKIAAVMQVAGGKCELHILNATDGKMINAIRSAEIVTFTDPKFIDDRSLVTAVRLHTGEMALAMADIETGSTVRLTTPSFNVVGFPSVDEGVIYFTATYGGNDDLFALRMEDQKIFRITNGPLGNYYVNAAAGKISWSAFTAEGYQVKQIDKKDIKWQEIGLAESTVLKPRFPVSHTDDFTDILQVKNRHFTVSKYKKATGLLNFHSWRPYYSDPIFTYSLYGENVLNTLQTELYYLYNRDEKTSAVGFTTVYGACFPYISAGSEYTFKRERPIGNRVRQWDQLDLRAGLNVPLFMTKGTSIMRFNAGTNYFYRTEFNKGFYKDSLGTTHFSYLLHYLSWNHNAQQSVQDVFPKLGYHFNLNYRYAITNIESWQWLAGAGIYLPGIASNHNIDINWAFQETDTLHVAFANRFPYARGYNTAYFARMWGFSANYHFPLLLPDWGFGNIIFLHRVRANAFYDLTRVFSKDKSATRDQRTVGGEIYLDTKWWNQYPLTFGFRVSYLLDNDFFTPSRNTVFEFILPVSIIPR